MEISVNDSAGNHPTRFLADLTQAMRSTAEAARLSTIEQCRLDAQAYAEQVNARTKEESEQFRKSADADVATIREQSKARMELIRQETERRISRRRELLDRDLEEFNAAIGVEVESVQHRVEAFQSEVAEFFERLLQGGADPTVFATMASQIPDPPSFDELDPNTLASDLRARRQQAEQEARATASGTSPAAASTGETKEALPDHWWLDSPAKLATRAHSEGPQ
jgi:hypothetical protein